EGFDPADPEASAYRRQPRPVTLSDGRQVMAWVYLGWPDFVAGLQPIPSDDWPTYLAAKKQALLEVPETSNV
ncbi:MAG: gamma-glutamylcyclotransferase family protein, partial [Chloroflexota bacterium]